MSLGRARPLFLASFSLFLLAMATAAGTATAGGSAKPVDPYANDPRSGAALNRDAAMHPTAPPPPLFGAAPQTIVPGAVNGPDHGPRDTQSETTVTGLGSDVVVGFNDSGSSRGGASKFTGYSHSSNDGDSFTDEGTLPTNDFGDAGDPNLAVDEASGAVYFSTLAFNVTNAIPVFKSTDGGVSFGAPVNAIRGGLDLDKDWMAVDNFPGAGNGTVYVCATDFGFDPARIVVTHSTDGGAKFDPFGGLVVSHAGQSQGCALAVAPDHSVYVAYFRGNSPNRLLIRRSTDGGASFRPAHEVATLNTTSINGDLDLNGGFRTNSFPSLAVNPVSGQVVVAYNDLTADGDANVYATTSDDGGTTWSAPIVVNNDAKGDQYFPAVAIARNGQRAFFGYYSRADDPSNTLFHRRGRLFTTHALGGGALTPSGRSFRLGPNSPPVIGQDPVINATYMGDYDQAFAAAGGSFYSSWADNVDGDAFNEHQPDVRFARIAAAQPTTDVGIDLAASPSTIDAGSDTTITAHVTVSGGTANDVVLNMSPVRGLAFQSASSTGNQCDVVDGFVDCTLGDLPAGTVENVEVVAKGGFPGGVQDVKANATTSSRDSNAADDTGSTSVTVDASSVTTQTFSTGTISVPIDDNSTVDVPLTVDPAGTVADLDAFVRIDHTFDADLEISLISPLGTVVDLSQNNGGDGQNYGSGTLDCAGTPTRFDDNAPTSIASASAPFAGTFKPQEPLAAFNGEEESGTWTLRVTDDAFQDTGTIGCAKLRIARF